MRHTTRDEAIAAYQANLKAEAENALIEASDHIERFKKFAATKNVKVEHENISHLQKIGVVAQLPNILTHLNTDLVLDKEGLFAVTDILHHFKHERIATGNLYSDHYIALSHPYFRRGFYEGSTYEPSFLKLFWEQDHRTNKTFLALDVDRVRINVDNSEYKEYDTWHGARFNRKIADIPDGTVKLRPVAGLSDFLLDFAFGGVHTLDIKWSTSGTIRNFYAEELNSENTVVNKDGVQYYPVRYVHAEFDTTLNHFRHLDGAIHLYTYDEYERRLNSDLNYNNKNDTHIKSLSKKLFKINGQLSVENWVALVSHFLTKNPLVHEYFEGQLPEHVLDIINATKQMDNDE